MNRFGFLKFEILLWLIGVILWFSFQFHDKVPTQTDWIVWKDSEMGVLVDGVLPPFNNNPGLKNQILPGDWLVQIDQKRIYKKEVVDFYIEKAKPKQYYLYFFKRKNKFNEYESFSVLISIQTVAPWQMFQMSSLWNIFVTILIFVTVTSIALLLIINPFLQTNPENARPLWLANVFGLGIFCTILLSYLFSFFEISLFNPQFNTILLVLAFIFNFFYWTVLFQIQSKKTWIYLFLIQYFAIFSLFIFHPQFFIQTSSLASLILLNACVFWAKNQTNFIKISFITCSFILIFYFNETDFLEFAQILTTILTSGILSYQLLRLGKIGLVLNQSIVYLGTFSLILIAFLGIHPLISQYVKDGFYISLLELIFLSILTLIARYLYIRNITFIRKYFLSANQHKHELIQDFETKITRFAHSDALLKSFQKLLMDVWNPHKTIIFLSDNEDELAVVLRAEFPDKLRMWSSSKPLSAFSFSQSLENKLIKEQIQVVILLPFTNNKGFLLLGVPSQRVYTLEDSEILIRICFQLALTLDILQLLENEKLLAQKNLEANLTALRSQINPHFLFNTLNTISALIHDAPDLAEKAVENLAFIFRYTLKYSSENFVSFKQEIELVNHYLAIEKIRFGKRLEMEVVLDEACENVMLPAFAIQTAVENCIKHGLSRLTRAGMIKIHVTDSEDFTICTVMDNGVGIDYDRIRKGTGLNNVLTRFETLYHHSNLVIFENLSSQNAEGTNVIFKIPKKPETGQILS